MIACSASTSSAGTPGESASICAPARMPPSSRPATPMPIGFDRPSSATVIASKPIVVSYPGAIWCTTPRSVVAPASPHSAPGHATSSARPAVWSSCRAYRAASELAPAARISKPSVVRKSRNQISGIAASARRTPRWAFGPRPEADGSAERPRPGADVHGDRLRRVRAVVSGPLIAQ